MKNIFIVLFALCVQVMYAANPIHGAKVETYSEVACNLPAPQNLVVTGTTSYTVSVQWTAVPGATNYRVAALVAGGTTPTITYTTGTTATVSGPPGTAITIMVVAGCGGLGGAYSSNVAQVTGFTDFIIDIVYKGYCGTASLIKTITGAGQQNLIEGVTYKGILKKINAPTMVHVFHFGVVDAGTVTAGFETYQQETTFGQLTNMTSAGCDPDVSDVEKVHVAMCTSNLSLCPMTVISNANGFALKAGPINAGFQLELYSCSVPDDIEKEAKVLQNDDTAIEERNNNTDITTQLTATPNPFRESIYLNFGSNEAAPIESADVQLYDFNGKICLQQEISNPSGTIALAAESLPSGIYCLRVRLGDTVQTYKLVKQN